MIGRFDVDEERWVPGSTEALRRLLIVSLIKLHFFDRSEGRLISGKPLFSIATAAEVSPEPAVSSTGSTGLSGVHPWFGGVRSQLDGLVELLDHIQESEPREAEVEAWIKERGTLTRGRYTEVLTRVPVHLGLAEVREARWQVTDLGLMRLESHDGLVAYRAFATTYVGFDETVAYLAAHPGARADAIHEYLNRVLALSWKSTAQAMRRANWLVAFGLAESDRGIFRRTERGRQLAESMSAEVRDQVESVTSTEETEDEIEQQGSPVLIASQVELPELVLSGALLEQCCAALNSGKHLMLVGAPGTGKSTIGQSLGQLATEVYGLGPPLLATASADWTTYDTIGGWTQRSDQTAFVRWLRCADSATSSLRTPD